MIDPVSRCAVFVPPSLAQVYRAIRWHGICGHEGLAEGEGYLAFSSDQGRKPEKFWQGEFRNGFFTGTAKAIEIKPLDQIRALVRLPGSFSVAGAAWHIVKVPPDGPLPPCGDNVAHIAIGIETREDLMHAQPLRRLMQHAAAAYRAACPQRLRLRLAVVSNDGLNHLGHGVFDDAPIVIARASLAPEDEVEALYNFQLVALDALAIDRRQRERDAAWRLWRDFSRSNWVIYWVMAKQLTANAERYEDKTVAVAGSFVRQIAPDIVVLRDNYGGEAIVIGLPVDLAKRDIDMVVAGISRRARHLPFSADKTVAIEATGWRACKQRGCDDYLSWMESQPTPFPWGEDQSRY